MSRVMVSLSAIKVVVPSILQWASAPIVGLIMGTRTGDIDPAIVSILDGYMSYEEVDRVMNKVGVLGISGVSVTSA